MRALGRYARIEDDEIRGLSNVFTVPEVAKARRRHILEPLLNDSMTAADFDDVSLPTFSSIRHSIGEYALQFDAAAFYDQFPLSPSVSSFFSFVTPSGSWRYTRLPMGFRPACFIAQTAMEVLADVDVPGVKVFVYIDNVLFSSDCPSSLERAAAIFKERCSSANVTLNDEANDSRTAFSFLGVQYDTAARTAKNTTKTAEKLSVAQQIVIASRPLHSPCSLRQVAAIFGILFWAQSIVPLPLFRYFGAMQYFRSLPLLAVRTSWNAPAPPLPPTARQHLFSWLADAAALPCVPIVPPPTPGPELRIWTDASAFGWGALVERIADGAILRLGRPWSREDRAQHNIASSVIAEPLAFRRAVLSVCTLATRAIEVRSDHLPPVWAWRRGSGRIAAYNDCIAHVAHAFPDLHVDVQFVKGVENKDADAISRGLFPPSCGQG